MTTQGFALSPAEQVHHENARRAILNARKLLHGWETMARMMARSDRLKVELTSTSTSCTDGKTIYIKVPVELGEDLVHDPNLCQKRDEYLLPMCHACAVYEDVNITVIHEVSHVIFGTFDDVTDYEKAELLSRAIALEADNKPDSKRALALRKRIEQAPDEAKRDYLNLSGIISPYLPFLINAAEDIRVNTLMQRDRPGTRKMFEGQINKVFRDGVQQDNGQTFFWKDAPPNAQAAIGVFCKTGGYPWRDYLAPEIAERLDDPGLDEVCSLLQNARSARDVYRLSFPLLENLRRLGFMRTPDEPEDEPEMPPQPQDSEEGQESPDDGEPGGDTDQSEPEGEGSEGSGDSDSTEEDSGESDGEGEDSDRSEEGSSDREQDPGPGEGSGEDSDSEGDGDSEDAGDSGGEGSDGSPDENGEGPDSSGQGGTPDDSSESYAGSGKSGSEDEGSASDAGNSEGGVEPGSSPREGGGFQQSTGDEGSQPTGAGMPEDPDTGQGDASQPSDEGPAPGTATGDGTPEIDGKDIGKDAEQAPEPYTDEDQAEDGTPDDIEHLFKVFSQHDKQTASPSEAFEETLNEKAIELALGQIDYFDSPSLKVKGVGVFRADDKEPHRMFRYRREVSSTELKVPEPIVTGSLTRLRLVFQDNMRGKKEPNLRTGKVNSRALARRVPLGDDRIFKKTTQPGRKDYFVVIGIDCSGSTSAQYSPTSSEPRLNLMKMAVAAKAEMLNRLGISFALYAHSGGSAEVQLFEIKAPNEPWGKSQKATLMALQPYSANLDGHTLEFYRKVAQKRTETDRLILYYTDGAMPAANFQEELMILQREIKMCKRLGIHLVGIGVNTDSPKEHGLDTILLDSMDDVKKVVKGLQERLT